MSSVFLNSLQKSMLLNPVKKRKAGVLNGGGSSTSRSCASAKGGSAYGKKEQKGYFREKTEQQWNVCK